MQSSQCPLHSTLPLRQDIVQVRILNLFPGTRSEALEGQLSCVDLSTACYQALSYTWGSSTKGRRILLNGKYFIPITDNLYDALRSLREHRLRMLWVDSICIDQHNSIERSKQVSLMGDIYRRAAAVDIWLGEPGYVPRLDKSLLCRPEVAEVSQYVVIRDANHSFNAKRSARYLDDPNFFSFFVCNDAQRFEQALSLTRPRWQERGWVVPEFVLAKSVYVCAGSARKIWEGSDDDLLAVESMIHAFADRYPNLESFMDRMWKLTECIPDVYPWMGNSQTSGANLFQTYRVMRTTETSDPRDKIYSLMGIVSKKDAAHLPPVDYSKTTVEVFARATLAFLTTAPAYADIGGDNFIRSFDAFALVKFEDKRLSGLPSWCIDFSRLQQISGRVDNKAVLFQSSRAHVMEDPSTYLPRMSATGLMLDVSAYVPDTIMDTCPQALPLRAKNDDAEANAASVDNVEVHTYAQCILLFARETSTLSKRQIEPRRNDEEYRLTGRKLGPDQLYDCTATSLYCGQRGEYLRFGKPSTQSCMEGSLSYL